ncbi:hypothetical protein [Puniceicoccus vermicola]|uniref:Uncharacterized protein n=1 Tax=Puniceicoccus vermicola TaxID=388746 RepID=A0A7X1E454_9BACT|nr:hypothetical protein [Puniceicoccus vermicola]MBC2602225.1 hypothetical protein [Puniceicoccus vermicola]
MDRLVSRGRQQEHIRFSNLHSIRMSSIAFIFRSLRVALYLLAAVCSVSAVFVERVLLFIGNSFTIGQEETLPFLTFLMLWAMPPDMKIRQQ